MRIGLPLAGGVLGLLALGDLPAARRLLGTAHPPAMLRTRYGPAYIQAQGFCHLAAGDGALALRKFLACGELMTRWRMDNSALLPWRRHAAEALIALGDQEKAGELLRRQIDLARGTSAVVHASSLRLLAGTLSPEHRRKPLEDAVRLLSRSRHAFEYAGALLPWPATATRPASTRAPNACWAWPGGSPRTWAPVRCGSGSTRSPRKRYSSWRRAAGGGRRAAGGGRRAAGGGEQEHAPALSGAERRVAVLAREGCTNREISERLFTMQSTVGRHLTGIYRKMQSTAGPTSSAASRWSWPSSALRPHRLRPHGHGRPLRRGPPPQRPRRAAAGPVSARRASLRRPSPAS
ncbi:helix-turn-helix transcriptional regulator [Streptomyces sp. MP131-18]|uniref:helix-turn-helix domain-containing protein n=1 Tax=Streptomyces sp. MP131-18 TaxID=1857892 RepID=UPI00097C6982|nr:helix-turn-helix transcriptional regulator [Streptomyces sp. MP131-18]ONK09834.1 ATP-dependent transcriptional regulator [Streptomyces sp. MP131-18]